VSVAVADQWPGHNRAGAQLAGSAPSSSILIPPSAISPLQQIPDEPIP
jgi:hypothetical protein